MWKGSESSPLMRRRRVRGVSELQSMATHLQMLGPKPIALKACLIVSHETESKAFSWGGGRRESAAAAGSAAQSRLNKGEEGEEELGLG